MTSLAVMQRYADRCAAKLGVTDAPVLRWAGGECKIGRNLAHCHIRDTKYPRGTICMRRGLEDWKATVAHEVAHLAVQDHHSLGFARRLVQLGQADNRERRMVLAHKRHVHKYRGTYYSTNAEAPERTCDICGKVQVGTITWKDKGG